MADTMFLMTNPVQTEGQFYNPCHAKILAVMDSNPGAKKWVSITGITQRFAELMLGYSVANSDVVPLLMLDNVDRAFDLMEDGILRWSAIFPQQGKFMIQGESDVLAYLGGIKE